MGKKSRVDPNIEPDLTPRGDPFHYGRHKYTPTEREQISKARSKDYRKYGTGSVVGAGASSSHNKNNVSYTVLNKPPTSSETYQALMAVRNGASPSKPKKKKFIKPIDYENMMKKGQSKKKKHN